jgi:hypothetical protein
VGLDLAVLHQARGGGGHPAAGAQDLDLDLGGARQHRADDLGGQRPQQPLIVADGGLAGADQVGQDQAAKGAAALLPAVGHVDVVAAVAAR